MGGKPTKYEDTDDERQKLHDEAVRRGHIEDTPYAPIVKSSAAKSKAKSDAGKTQTTTTWALPGIIPDSSSLAEWDRKYKLKKQP